MPLSHAVAAAIRYATIMRALMLHHLRHFRAAIAYALPFLPPPIFERCFRHICHTLRFSCLRRHAFRYAHTTLR